MSDASVSTIAQLVFADPQPLNFARVVGDLHTVLSRFRGQNLRIEWDCEDIAIFDLAEARIMLAWNDQPGKGYSACLSVSVGPLPYAPPDLAVQAGHESMCSRLIERLQARFPATAILWHQTDQPITPDVLDRLVDSLPALMELFPFQEPDWMAEAIADARIASRERKMLFGVPVEPDDSMRRKRSSASASQSLTASRAPKVSFAAISFSGLVIRCLAVA